MKFKVKKDFSWAHRGIDVVAYQAGDDLESDDEDLIKVATTEGWIAKPARGGNKTNIDPDNQSDNKDGDPSGGEGKDGESD